MSSDWRTIESKLITALCRQNCPLRYRHGQWFVFAKSYDDTGEAIVHELVNIEALARDLVDSLSLPVK
jgi:hypothetical protein